MTRIQTHSASLQPQHATQQVTLKRFFSVLLLSIIALLCTQAAIAVEIEATVDRSTVEERAVISLTVEVSENATEKPDFSVLNVNFEVLGTQQSNNTSLINGRFSSKSVWLISLIPKQTGYIIIPSITYKNIQSKPIKIKVNKASQTNKPNRNEAVFIESSVEKKRVYVQEQLMLSLKIFHQPRLLDGDLGKVELANAVMEQVGEQKTYRQTVGGISYGVYEINYVIYPQSSGTLDIPSFVFNGSVAVNSRRNNGSFLNPFMNQGRRVRVASKNLSIEVKPKPTSYPANTPWLPAKALTLNQRWSPRNPSFTVGEAVTRTIEIVAAGQASVTIPALPDLSNDRYKTYPDKSANNDKQSLAGVTGTRTESVAIVPTKAGSLVLPTVKVTWWDTQSDQLKEAVIEETAITVKASATQQAPVQIAPLQAPVQTPTQTSTTMDPAQPTLLLEEKIDSPVWKLLTAIFAALWLISIAAAIYLYRRPVKPAAQSPETSVQSYSDPNIVIKLADETVSACEQHNPQLAQLKILALSSAIAQHKITSVANVKTLFHSPDLNEALSQLETVLYQSGAAGWNGKELAHALQIALKDMNKVSRKDKQPKLAAMYPS